ncbi:hypothetical protein BDZ89DRAFT_1173203 [Hymenopellis radicata]|nr:hypothetical protein BDZ89DRAFT_1173203 [Hymenopellis radicata]
MAGPMSLAFMLNGDVVPPLTTELPPPSPSLPHEPPESTFGESENASTTSHPSAPLHNISELLEVLSNYVKNTGDIYAPPDVADALRGIASRLPNPSATAAPQPEPSPPLQTPAASTIPASSPSIPASASTPTRIERNVRLTQRTSVSELHVYEDPTAFVEYPATSNDGIGYLFRQDIHNWRHPNVDFVYSFGEPGGFSGNQSRTVDILVDSTGEKVRCTTHRKTCQGVKICPQTDIDALKEPHCAATPELLRQRLSQEREERDALSSPTADTHNRTSAFYAALKRVGCHAREQQVTDISAEDEINAFIRAQVQESRRGYTDKIARCQGQIIYSHDWKGKPMVQCEHYDSLTSRDHYNQRLNDSLDTEYLEALFLNDLEEICRIEDAAMSLGYGPKVDCNTVVNVTSQRVCCPFNHRDSEQRMYQPLLKRLECAVEITYYEPLQEYREACPYILYVIKGVHKHPIPLPVKTPPRICAVLNKLLENVGEDLADMTVRRFLRHPVVTAFVRNSFPDNPAATLVDLHISLANRAHLHHYLKKMKDTLYPDGTGWKGALHLYRIQTERYPVEAQYIRKIIEVDGKDLTVRSDDECTQSSDREDNLKIIICMTRDQSRRLLKAQYLQCDISFKRIIGQREFILAGLDRNANMAITYCRVYMNRETAQAHCRVFLEIDNIVEVDTGSGLQWRHLYALDIKARDGYTLELIGDAHGGQACGFGLYLQTKASRLSGYDLHQPSRLLKDLSEYDHLHRCFRNCNVHYDRNIDDPKKALSKEIRNVMKSLACIRHPDWDGALATIREKGGKAGNDWLNNKINSKFAFQGICQEKSFIPLDIWMAGDFNDNIVETSHSNVNFEGRSCTLVGGMEKGRRFDAMQVKALKAYEESGIRTSYASGHRIDNSVKSIKRHYSKQHRKVSAQDNKIQQHNRKVNEAIQRGNEIVEKGRMEREHLLALQKGPNSAQNERAIHAAHVRIDRLKVALAKVKLEVQKLASAGEELAKENGGSGMYTPFIPENHYLHTPVDDILPSSPTTTMIVLPGNKHVKIMPMAYSWQLSLFLEGRISEREHDHILQYLQQARQAHNLAHKHGVQGLVDVFYGEFFKWFNHVLPPRVGDNEDSVEVYHQETACGPEVA